MAEADDGTVRCFSCDRPAAEVGRLVSGAGLRICGACVAAAEAIVEEYRDDPFQVRLPRWTSMTDEQMLDKVPRVAALADQVEAELRGWVRELRRRGVTWARIGQALGITRQSAWERFSGEE
ncbi:ClpX C4-type zinc finger protein [Actinomadura viridis]|uniref:ClpX-type ZB domain-containing protein n=1 Tax=Actinomadura viridis TaxID=58110 RepID=A0A931DLS5_9ACTN|nr:ClpX C4-type zinc finger protein [Actinomadura viridis]MBG6092320.1 hypothetical protein [Actinomadura viridis]